MVKNKKAQMKIQQMAFMLIAVFLFFAIAGLLVAKIKISSLRESASYLREKNAMLLVSKLANSPEFSCGESLGYGKINCVDADKVMMLKKNPEIYKNFWGSGVTNIAIRKIYPVEEEILCDTNNYPQCNLITLLGEEISTSEENYISLCRKSTGAGKTYDKCELAVLMVSYK